MCCLWQYSHTARMCCVWQHSHTARMCYVKRHRWSSKIIVCMTMLTNCSDVLCMTVLTQCSDVLSNSTDAASYCKNMIHCMPFSGLHPDNSLSSRTIMKKNSLLSNVSFIYLSHHSVVNLNYLWNHIIWPFKQKNNQLKQNMRILHS